MIKFSACKYNKNIGKNYYKNFKPYELESMQEVGEMMYSHSLSSHLYNAELSETAEGNLVPYRKSGNNITGSGSLIFIDVDNKVKLEDGVNAHGKMTYEQVKATGSDYVTFEALTTALEAMNVSAVITESRSSKPDWQKFHVAIEVDSVGDINDFTKHYLGFIEALGINAKGLDLVMRVSVQNLAPAYENKERPITVIDGEPLEFSAYEPSENYIKDTGVKYGKSGDYTEFEADYETLVLHTAGNKEVGEYIEEFELESLLEENGKIRTTCHHGFAHDGRYDSGFIRYTKGDSEIWSYCAVCGDKTKLWARDVAGEFEDLGELPEEDVVKPTLEVVSFNELSSEEPEVIYLNGVPYPKVGLTMLAGDGGVGKSYVSIKQALAYLEMFEDERVLFWFTEDNQNIVRQRIAMMCTDSAVVSRMDFISTTINSFKRADNAIKPLVELTKKYGMTVLDPLISFYHGEENNNTEARKFGNKLRQLSGLIILIHHSAKSGSTSRGASDFRNMVRLVYKVEISKLIVKKRGSSIVTLDNERLSGYRAMIIDKDNWGGTHGISKHIHTAEYDGFLLKCFEIDAFDAKEMMHKTDYVFGATNISSVLSTVSILPKQLRNFPVDSAVFKMWEDRQDNRVTQMFTDLETASEVDFKDEHTKKSTKVSDKDAQQLDDLIGGN